MIRLFSVAFAVGLALGLGRAAAQTEQVGSIRGQVYDQVLERPVSGATVTILENGRKVHSSDQGTYLFNAVEPGRYTLAVSAPQFKRKLKHDVMVQPGDVTDADVTLIGDFTDMEEFIVEEIEFAAGSEEQLLDIRFDASGLVDSIGAERMSLAGAGDAASAARLVPGVTISDNKAVIRGLPDRYVVSLLSGVRVPSADEKTRAVELDQFPSSVIESVQVAKTFMPDQQADASGGAVDIVLLSMPEQSFFEIGVGTSMNTQVYDAGDAFLTYEGGGLDFLGLDEDRQDFPDDSAGSAALGVSRGQMPINYDLEMSGGIRHEFDNGVAVGGIASLFYERDASFTDDGVDNDYIALFFQSEDQFIMLPDGIINSDPDQTALFDVVEGVVARQWGGYGAVGLESENHELKVSFLHTRTIEDKALLLEDTRGREFAEDFGFDTSEGFGFSRRETLVYQERLTQSLQFSGTHALPWPRVELESWIEMLAPEVAWSYSVNKAEANEPDQRAYRSVYSPLSGKHSPDFPTDLTVNAERSYDLIVESGDQLSASLRLPYRQWSDREGAIKVGYFQDSVERQFRRETFDNLNDPVRSLLQGGQQPEQLAPFDEFFLSDFPGQSVDRPQGRDVDYDGAADITAYYWMLEVPLASFVKVSGGMRYETTEISVTLKDIEPNAFLADPITGFAGSFFDNSGDRVIITDPSQGNFPIGLPVGDARIEQSDVLPAISVIVDPIEGLTIRAAYTETVARPTFRELSVALQQEFLGGDKFVGNPNLSLSAVENYDLRLDYRPTEGSLISASWFRKDITDPIELVQRYNTRFGSFFVPQNFPEARMEGYEFEVRQDLGVFWEQLSGLSVGGNLTLIDSEVSLPAAEIVPATGNATRPMVDAPEYLMNLNLTYEAESTGTQVGLFYTRQGDTLVAGANPDVVGPQAFVPSIYAIPYDTLNLTVSQKVGEYVKLKFSAKNLTNPEIQTVYRSDVTPDTVRTSYRKGIDFSFSVSAHIPF